MPPPSDASSSAEVKLGVYYDLGRKEIQLRFESSGYALAYQAKNPEARIYADKPRDVWLPIDDSMRSLRSSDGYGMVIIFKSKEHGRTWLSRSVLGADVSTSDGEFGVRFKRAWTRKDFDKCLDITGSQRGLRVPNDRASPDSRPPSRNERSPVSPQPAAGNSDGKPRNNPPQRGYYEPYDSPASKRYSQ